MRSTTLQKKGWRELDDRLISYLYYFNIKADYFLCHEYGEDLWLEEGRPIVLKGLIQAAVCLYHLENGNVRGACRMWQRARSYLGPYQPSYQGIRVDSLIADIDAVFRLVPNEWKTTHQTPEVVRILGLPRVYVQIENKDVADALRDWVPQPLSHE